jgi:protein ImuB
MSADRRICVWCPDWPVTTARLDAGLDTDAPLAVVVANRVVACSHPARSAGVKRGQRRREAQAACPSLVVLPRDEAAEARVFEPVVAALEAIAPGVEITRPGLAAIGVRGPTRYFGGETGVLHALSRGVAGIPALGGADLLIGIADGAFAAEQAARRGLVVDPGASARFLADLPIETLDPSGTSALIDLLRRLGIRTLGTFAALPPRDVLARFGPDGLWAHRQAGGHDDRPVSGRRPPVEFTVTLDLEPPVDRVDTIAFSARGIAEQFVGDLAAHGLACTCLELQALTENGEETVRRWRHAGVLSTVDVLDRVRWQLEGWLSAPSRRPTGGVSRVRLVPIETVPTGAHQQALWGGSGAEDERAARALARVQTLLGHGSVLTPVLDGGRDPGQRTRVVPWGDEPTPLRSPEQPWPGQLPAPAPTVLLDPPRPAQVLDAARRPVLVTERGAIPAAPAFFGLGADVTAVASWAGPWPVDERWWSPDSARRVVRCQIVDVRGRAYLVTGTMPTPGSDSGPRWQVDAVYD